MPKKERNRSLKRFILQQSAFLLVFFDCFLQHGSDYQDQTIVEFKWRFGADIKSRSVWYKVRNLCIRQSASYRKFQIEGTRAFEHEHVKVAECLRQEMNTQRARLMVSPQDSLSSSQVIDISACSQRSIQNLTKYQSKSLSELGSGANTVKEDQSMGSNISTTQFSGEDRDRSSSSQPPRVGRKKRSCPTPTASGCAKQQMRQEIANAAAFSTQDEHA